MLLYRPARAVYCCFALISCFVSLATGQTAATVPPLGQAGRTDLLLYGPDRAPTCRGVQMRMGYWIPL
jgi:hypothetical protein